MPLSARRFFFLCCLPVLLNFLCAAVSVSAQETAGPYKFCLEWHELDADLIAHLNLPSLRNDTAMVVLWLDPEQGYHTYAHNPGPGAMPTVVNLLSDLPVQVRYMPGVARSDVFAPGSSVLLYEGRTPVFLLFPEGPPPPGTRLGISLLACSEVNCIPVRAELTLSPPDDLPKEDSGKTAWREAFLSSRADRVIPSAASALSPPEISDPPDNSMVLPKVPLSSQAMRSPARGQADNTGSFSPRPFVPMLEVEGPFKAILFGMAAGLLLNIMPCVLPVLTLKVTTLLAAGGSGPQNLRHFRQHNLYFAAGILTWFAILALLLGLSGMLWGQLFQSSALIFAMMLLVFCLALSMFDVYHLPVLDLKATASSSSPRMQAWSTGMTATLLATPCSGPLLGGVLGWSLTQNTAVMLIVFLSTGMGMALPYLLLAANPAMARFLPRPGEWMLAFERIVGFLLLGTALYLFSLLPEQQRLPSLALLLVAALALWCWGHWGGLHGSRLRRLLIGLSGLGAVVLTGWWFFFTNPPAVAWHTFDADTFRSELGRQAMLVEFTADWCPTCKVLERTVLTDHTLSALTREHGLTLIRADLTRSDVDAEALLSALGSASIPFLAIFPEGEDAASPVVLRDLYTSTQLKEAVKQALVP